MLHPVNFFPACQIKDLSVRCRSQRRRSIVTQFVLLNASQMLHPVNFFPACQIKDLSVRCRSQRRRSIVTQFVLLNASQMLHPVNFFPACQIKDLSVRCRSQRRLTTVTAKTHRFRLHPVLFNLSSLPRAFALLMFFIDSYGQVSTT